VARPDLEDARRISGDVIDTYDSVEDKEQCHDWRKAVPNFSCAKLLYQEEDRQNGDRNANDGACAMKSKSSVPWFHEDVRRAAIQATPRRHVIATAASDVQTKHTSCYRRNAQLKPFYG